MAPAREAFVAPRGELWTVKVNGRQIGGGHSSQAGAITAAHTWLQNNGGGELVVLSENGDLRRKDSVYPGTDPRNIPG